MASNFGNRDQLGDQVEIFSEQESATIQRLILEEIQRKPAVTNLESIYWAVRQRFASVSYLGYTDSIKKRIVDMIKSTFQSLQMKVISGNECDGCEPVKLKNRKGEKSKNETIKTNKQDDYDHDHMLALQEEREREIDENELKEAILQSKKHLDEQMVFDQDLKETLAKSYQEEKSKLLTMLHAEDFDFNILADQLNKVLPDESAVKYKGTSLIHRSALILAIIELFDQDCTIINAVPFQNHIRHFGQRCLSVGAGVIYQQELHQKNPSSTFNVFAINDYLVNIEIRGDGNCMWSSISHTLVGDYRMMESLRLLTAYALMQYSETFSEILTRQTSKFSYSALTLEQLVRASLSLQSWGDEFHLIALSLALKRPIYSYGSLNDIPESASMGYEQFRQCYEIESFPNHFKFIGDANDTNNEPILLHYDGFSHYSSVLKRSDIVQPLIPFSQIIDALFNGNKMAQREEQEKLIDIDCNMTKIVSNAEVEWKGNNGDCITDDDDDGKSDEIAKLNKDLDEKSRLLQKYESFFLEVKKMLDYQKIDLRQLRDFVEMVENNRK